MIDFSKLKVLVCGEVGLDEYLVGTSNRRSPEADVPIINGIQVYRYPGMAANLAQNLTDLGASVTVVASPGRDDTWTDLIRLLEVDRMIYGMESNRDTIVKTRVVCNGEQLARLDREDNSPFAEYQQKFYVDAIHRRIPEVDAIFLQDYGKGLWSDSALQSVILAAVREGKPVYVDPWSRRDLLAYAGASMLKANFKETLELLRKHPAEMSPWTAAARIQQALPVELAVVTLGAEGSSYATPEQTYSCVAPMSLTDVVDVAGAGDTFMAVLGLGLLLKDDRPLSYWIDAAHRAATDVVSKPRTATTNVVRLNQLLGF